MTGARFVAKGFRFGMLLQLAVGPVCLAVFQTASERGLWAAMAGVAAVTLVDGLFIAAANLGVAAALGRESVRKWLKVFGAAVLALFGAATALGPLGVTVLPALQIAGGEAGGAFLRLLLLTLSNPLTVLFWAGVFSGKVAELQMDNKEVWLFGAGALLSTAVSLSLVAVVAGIVGAFLPALAIDILNVAVGLALVFFGVRMALQKERN